MDYKLYYFTECPFSQKVLRAIENFDVADKIELRNIRENENYHKELIEQGGKDQVPCLFIDGQALYESSDIISYISDNIAKQ